MGFISHLRDNGFCLGVGEAELSLKALTHVESIDPKDIRHALRAVCTGCVEDVERFDDLFDAFWMNGGRVATKTIPSQATASDHVHSSRDAAGADMAGGAGAPTTPDDRGEDPAEADGEGKLLASLTQARMVRADNATDAYLFHTRLVRIAEALRDKDALRALGRLSVLADGFGGGSKIGASLMQFSQSYARRFVDGRTVVLILSDGYDTDNPDLLGAALAKLKLRGCKIIWLKPLKGWEGYEPVTRGMAAALPHLDLFRPANTLADLAALEQELTRL